MQITGTHHVALRTGNFAAMREFYREAALHAQFVVTWVD